jgi:hypothetical protein
MASEAFFRFSPRILEHLGISAYNSLQKCLTELAANAYDADATKVEIQLPDVIDNNAIIEIADNGTGMNEIGEKFLFIGRNRREEGERTANGRLIIGSKGIGKLAGFGIASKIKLTSWKAGQLTSISLDRDDFENIRSLEEQAIPIITARTQRANGTKIQLLNLNEELNLPSLDVVRRHLFRALPKVPDFRIYVNGIECTAEDIHGEKHQFSQEIEDLGQVNGFYIIANARQPDPGLSIRVRGRIVTEPSLFGIDTRAHGFFTAEKIAGEINAEFLDPEQENGITRELINTSRDGFLEDSPVVIKLNEWAGNFISGIIRGVDSLQIEKRADALLSRPAILERLDRMPAHVRGTATNVVRSILVKLRNVDDDEAADLIEWILRYYESNILRELMRAIIAADVQEAEKLAGLIQEWGLKQVNSVVDIIKTQVQIIGKLEELVASDRAKEVELHKLIEGNLWLVRQGLEIWSSDKPLKAVLDEHLDILYKNKKYLRPDLICRSRMDGNEAIIIEFKRPKEKVVMQHVTQALEYEGIIKKHRPNISFDVFVVGREYDPSVLVAREKLEKAALFMWSFSEILQSARMRFERILEILGQ